MALERVAKPSGYPTMSTVGNGNEFASNMLDASASEQGVMHDFIHPGC
jgi:hypothetical protein